MPLFLGQNKQNREMANSVGLSSLLMDGKVGFFFFAHNTVGRKKKDYFHRRNHYQVSGEDQCVWCLEGGSLNCLNIGMPPQSPIKTLSTQASLALW